MMEFPIPEGYMLLEYVGTMKCLGPDGGIELINIRSDDLTAWEALGMAEAVLMNAREDMESTYYAEDVD